MKRELRVRPNRILVVVDKKGVRALNNETPGANHPDRVWGLPGGTVIFVIENQDAVSHTVNIPIDRFVPNESYKVRATAGPLVAKQNDSVQVGPGQRATLVLRLQPFEHFEWNAREPWKSNPDESMTYKYDINTLPAGAKEPIRLDPDLEVDRP